MNETLDGYGERLERWVTDALPGVGVIFEAPSEKIGAPCACLYALGLEDLVYRHGTTGRRPPQGFRFRYLVTAWAPTPTTAQEMLGELIFSAMDEADFDIELTTTDARVWQALGILPRPAFFLFIPVRRDREEAPVPRVVHPPRVNASVAVPMVGRVVGPGGLPLMRARVEMPSLEQTTFTDADGQFRFPAVPKNPAVRKLRVHACGTTRELTLDGSLDYGEPLLVPFDP